MRTLTSGVHASSALAAAIAIAVVAHGAHRAGASPSPDGSGTHASFGERWVSLTPAGTTPPKREGGSLSYDAGAQRMILFGGFDGTQSLNDVWVLDSPPAGPVSWRALQPRGKAPPGRSQHAAVFDAARRRLVIFGGWDKGREQVLGDLWILDLAQGDGEWQNPLTAGGTPGRRFGAGAVYDPARERMVMVGGFDRIEGFNEAWELRLRQDPPQWRRMTPAGTPPEYRDSSTVAFDHQGSRMIIFGGMVRWRAVQTGDVYFLWLTDENGSWERPDVSGVAPAGRMDAVGAYDVWHQRLLIHGGFSTSNRVGLDDVWSFDVRPGAYTWEQLHPPGGGPGGRIGISAGLDEANGRITMFGGYLGPTGVAADVWGLELAALPTPTPTAPTPTLTLPPTEWHPTPTESIPTPIDRLTPTPDGTRRASRAFLPNLAKDPPPPAPTASPTATTPACSAEDIEPNDYASEADNNPPFCMDVNLKGRLPNGDRADVFRIEITRETVIDVDLDNLPPGTDYDLDLWDASLTTAVAVSQEYGRTPEHIQVSVSPGRYYIRVYPGAEGQSPQAYWLRWFAP